MWVMQGIREILNAILQSNETHDAMQWLPYILLAVFALILLLIGIFARRRQQCEKVKSLSTKYHQMKAINQKYHFYEFFITQKIRRTYQSLQQFRRCSMRDILIDDISERKDFWRELLKEANENRTNFLRYCGEIDTLRDTEGVIIQGSGISQKRFLKLEKQLCEENRLCPPLSVEVVVYASYSSRKGRNHYEDTKQYSFDEVKEAYHEMIQIEKKRNSEAARRRAERAKVTPSLRYKVFSRDHFRCQICGASQEDGVTLHVDHIIPVSKGGKTEMSNLRTLCDMCNLGKGDKIEDEDL